MCAGIAVCRTEFTDEFVARHGLESRIVTRGSGESEVRFLLRDKQPVLPAWIDRQLSIVEWAGLCPQEQPERWQHGQAVVIPAHYGLERGIWYQVIEGLQGVIVRGRVYVLTTQATHYYQVMTRSRRMPVLVGQVI